MLYQQQSTFATPLDPFTTAFRVSFHKLGEWDIEYALFTCCNLPSRFNLMRSVLTAPEFVEITQQLTFDTSTSFLRRIKRLPYGSLRPQWGIGKDPMISSPVQSSVRCRVFNHHSLIITLPTSTICFPSCSFAPLRWHCAISNVASFLCFYKLRFLLYEHLDIRVACWKNYTTNEKVRVIMSVA